MKKKKHLVTIAIYVLILGMSVPSCEDFVQVDPPRTSLVRETVFASDETALAAIARIYSKMIDTGFASGNNASGTPLMSLSSDELVSVISAPNALELQQFGQNELLPSSVIIASFWRDLYQYIYYANSIIEGLSTSNHVTEKVKEQILGEAFFIRAFSHFYLVNLFGDVPIVLTTDYQKNAIIERMPVSEVYEQIIEDLIICQSKLLPDYSFSKGERVRPNKWAATALLARVYLFIGDWTNAETQASSIIEQSNLYSLPTDVNKVFLANSSESIWQLLGIQNTNEAATFIFSGNPKIVSLRPEFVNSFEAGDKRSAWVGTTTDGSTSYYYPYKYKVVGVTTPIQEYSMVLRLSEQYLIRGEARAQLGDLVGARNDINVMRNRAGLPNALANDEGSILSAIEQERKAELFAEWGHRWLDLKRWNKADGVLKVIKPLWQVTDALYPIPVTQLKNDPSFPQNFGY